MIASKPRGGARRGGRGGARGGGAAPAAAAAGGAVKGSTARARYAQPVPAAQVNNRQAQAAANVQGGQRNQEQDAFKIIISNLPLDVDDAAVRVSSNPLSSPRPPPSFPQPSRAATVLHLSLTIISLCVR